MRAGKPIVSNYSIVYCRFWDHCQDTADAVKPVICEVFGVLKHTNDLTHTIVTWVSDFNLGDSNSDAYCILRSAIVELRYLDVKGGRRESTNEKRYRGSKSDTKKGSEINRRR